MKSKQNLSFRVSEDSHWLMPRERARARGTDTLSDVDLIQAILGTGTRTRPVRQLAQEVLSVLEGQHGFPSIDTLCNIHGIGQAKAALMCSAFELARRLFLPDGMRISKPADVVPLLRHWADRKQEYFLSIGLNGAHEVLFCRVVSVGLINRTLVHPREVFVEAIAERATSLVVAHNHPSGNLEPSVDDLDVTARLRLAGETIGIPVLDHIIFSQDGHISLLEKGHL